MTHLHVPYWRQILVTAHQPPFEPSEYRCRLPMRSYFDASNLFGVRSEDESLEWNVNSTAGRRPFWIVSSFNIDYED